ncbi:chemotaxis protein CheW [Myxococcota bacterium]|nr:chemotaxis protein CheW [Myxococcota bacterium]
MSTNDEVIQDFLIESREGLERLDQDLVALEREPASAQLIQSIFRSIHTVKGTSGFFGFERLETLTHSGENLLAMLRDEMLKVDARVISALLRMVDKVREILDHIEATGTEKQGDDSELIAEIEALMEFDETAEPAAVATAPSAPAPVAAAPTPPPAAPAPAPVAAPEAEAPKFGELLVKSGIATTTQVDAAVQQQIEGDPRRVGEILVEAGVIEPAAVADTLHQQNAVRSASDSSIRVDVSLLDKLMTLAGELVLTRNQILQYAAAEQDSGLALTCQRLNVITSEMQESVMRTRMQPIDNVWSKFPRVVRDLAALCGKQVRIEFEGKETDLDRTILEAIKDPLTHIVRNAVDHGIELPAERLAAGKSAEGVIRMRAFHEGGQVNIEIADDGKGLDLDRIQKKAIERGLITAVQAQRMSEREISNLIFLPGFSTAEKVTNVSGRGVGMDVVRTNVERIGGAVEIESRRAAGTTIKVKIPLTLAIIPALIVRSGGDRYAIPQVSLLELVSFSADDANHKIEHIHNAPVYRLRGNLLPLVFLDQSLGLGGGEVTAGSAVRIVVLESEGRQFGLVVDEVNDSEEIVVKPLGRHLKGLALFAGATILGDGAVALILDIRGLAQKANVLNAAAERSREEKARMVQAISNNKRTLLVVGVGIDERIAIPLSEVARLEEFKRTSVERSGGHEVIQYRGEILPLVNLSSLLGRMSQAEEGNLLQVIVCQHEGHSMGLVVDRILDIVEQEVVVQKNGGQHGILGSAVIQQRVTELLDLPVAFSSVAFA